jgi:hypothetical protein
MLAEIESAERAPAFTDRDRDRVTDGRANAIARTFSGV